MALHSEIFERPSLLESLLKNQKQAAQEIARQAPPRLRHALVVGISQSGQSPGPRSRRRSRLE